MDTATVSFRQAVALDSGLADAHYNLGNALRDQGELEYEITSYEYAIRVRSRYSKARKNLLSVLLWRGKQLGIRKEMKEAIKCYERAVQLDVNSAVAQLGSLWVDRDQHERAVTCYQHALAIQPNCIERASISPRRSRLRGVSMRPLQSIVKHARSGRT